MSFLCNKLPDRVNFSSDFNVLRLLIALKVFSIYISLMVFLYEFFSADCDLTPRLLLLLLLLHCPVPNPLPSLRPRPCLNLVSLRLGVYPIHSTATTMHSFFSTQPFRPQASYYHNQLLVTRNSFESNSPDDSRLCCEF